jgi:hypothetical protein
VDGKGDLTVRARATAVSGEGFGYQMATVSREGIRTVKGQPIPR